ncbi:putative MICOS complex subunit MIC12 [[Candida] railenensis]|uniref:MICOS complex subunit MIC12 n=1 Tax=[Candida] railenensis TaxID=45579 RepID=A0A9P0QRH7_9ASCO|nr:putative MICOS complex subunit MIC12 [[Candida] railenensis]
MGGRIHGFLGGVLLTASLTYYTGQYIEKNSRFVSTQLQHANTVVTDRILSNKGIPKPIAVDNNIDLRTRPFGETAKDIWNDEIIKMVNWLYSINWYSWGVEADKKFQDLTNKVAESIAGEAKK